MVRVEPDAVVLHPHGGTAHTWDAETLDGWLADLRVLAEGLGTIGAPTPREPALDNEVMLQHHPARQPLYGSTGCLCCSSVFDRRTALTVPRRRTGPKRREPRHQAWAPVCRRQVLRAPDRRPHQGRDR